MSKTFRKFDSHAAADAADRAFYRSLTPEQRLDILLELVHRYREGFDEAGKGFQRVYSIVERARR